MSKFLDLAKMAVDKGQHDDVRLLVDELVVKVEKLDTKTYQAFVDSLEGITYRISQDEATSIVRNMQPRGQNWSYEQVKEFVNSRGIETNCVSWYLVMNMVFNDYFDTAKMFGLQNDAEFYFSLAKDFIEDPDAKPYKIEKYFQ